MIEMGELLSYHLLAISIKLHNFNNTSNIVSKGIQFILIYLISSILHCENLNLSKI